MWQAFAGALVPVAIGVGIALTPWFRRELLRPARVVALLAVVAVVLLELLPRAYQDGGLPMLAVFLVALVAPAGLERLASRWQGAETITVDVAFAVLLLHQVIDGVEVGGAHRVGISPWPVTLAIAIHSVPFVAAVTLGAAQRRGPRNAAARGLALLVATGIGTQAGIVLTANLDHGPAWMPALLAGLLLHVAGHDLGEHRHAHEES